MSLLEEPLTQRTCLPELRRAECWDDIWNLRLPVVYPRQPRNPERRARCERNARAFILEYFSHYVKELNLYLDETIEIDQDAVLAKSPYVIRDAEAAPRSIGKTTKKRILVIWAVQCYRHGPFAVFFGATGPKGKESIDFIRNEWRTNELLREDFPEISDWLDSFKHDPKLCKYRTPHANWSDDGLYLPWGGFVEAYGMDTSLQGVNIRGQRPWWLIFEDTEGLNIASSETLRATLKNRVLVEAMNMLDKSKPGIASFVGTIYTPNSFTAEMTDRKLHPEWRGRRYAGIIKFPKREDLWNDFEIAAKGDVINVADLPDENTIADKLKIARTILSKFEPTLKKALGIYVKNFDEMNEGAELLDNNRQQFSLFNLMYEKAINPAGFWCAIQNAPKRDDESTTQKQLQVEHLMTRRIGPQRRVVPAWGNVVLTTCDVNAAKFHWESNAFGSSGEWCLIDQGYVETGLSGDEYKMADSQKVKTLMLKQAFPAAFDALKEKTTGVYFQEGTGELKNPALYGIDCGGTNKNYAWINDVIEYCRRPANDRRWRPLKGARWTEQHLKKFVNRRWGCELELNPGKRHDWDADYGKSRVMESLEIGPYGKDSEKLLPGVRIFHAEAPREYMRHLTSEYYLEAMPDDAAAQKEVKIGWNPLPGIPNHWFDSAAMAWVLYQIWKFERQQVAKAGQRRFLESSSSAGSHDSAMW